MYKFQTAAIHSDFLDILVLKYSIATAKNLALENLYITVRVIRNQWFKGRKKEKQVQLSLF